MSTTPPDLFTPLARIGVQNKGTDSLASAGEAKSETSAIDIKRIVRAMRGGSQARLVEAEDGRFYVAKFLGNPQGDRTLVNEWIAQSILSHLGIPTPPLCILRLPEQLRSAELYFSVGDKRIPVEGQWHLGSLCPVNPETNVIFDFLPTRLLEKVSNLNDFAKVFVVDRWLYQTDTRQAVFVRDRSLVKGQIKFKAHFIDHGQTFSGSKWEFREASLHGLYVDRAVYSLINMPAICDQTVSQIESLTREQVFSPLETLPNCLLSIGEREKLGQLLQNLHSRRLKLRRMVTNQLVSLNLRRKPGNNDGNNNVESGTKRKGVGSVGHVGTSSAVG